MKQILILCTLLALSLNAFAKKGGPETEALYVVPTTPELIDHSRFIVKIVDAFAGPQTEKISYVFPEILIGEPDRLIELYRIEGTENSWKGDLITAHCTTLGDDFSCDIYINRPQQEAMGERILNLFFPKAFAEVINLCQGQAITHVQKMGLPEADVASFTKVIGHFCSNEPAGFLSYEFQ